jgi:hypothetical protein
VARSRSWVFARSLVGPHVALAAAIGSVHGVRAGTFLHHPDPAHPIPSFLVDLAGSNAGPLLAALALVVLGAGAAVLARRLTGNALVSSCTAAVLVLQPLGAPALGDTLAAGLGLLAAGVRVLPAPDVAGAPLMGRREVLAIALLLAAAFCGDVVLAMPLLILVSDLAFSPGPIALVLRRTGIQFFLHLAAVAPAAWSPQPFAASWLGASPGVHPAVFATLAVLAATAILLRGRIRQTLVVAAASAILWLVAADAPRLVVDAVVVRDVSFLALFGAALFLAASLWRLAVAVTEPRVPTFAVEPPLPSVPALRDLARAIREEPRPSLPASPPATTRGQDLGPRADPGAGLRSTVETAVGGAVAATLEQLRLAFKAPRAGEPPLPPAAVLWSRLLEGTGATSAAAEGFAGSARAWGDAFEKHVAPRIEPGATVVCAGATPWPLIAAIAGKARSVTVVERGRHAARRAAQDLDAVANAHVVRHDRGLDPVRDGTADVILCVFEAATQIPAQTLALLRECSRVVKRGGVVGLGFADLALGASQEALVSGAPGESFVHRAAIESLARLAGFGRFDVATEVLPMLSIAWLRFRPEAAA